MIDEPAAENTGVGCATIEVVYSVDALRENLRTNLGLIVDRLNEPNVLPTLSNIELGLAALNRIAAFAAMSAKEPDWSPEREFRIVALGKHGKFQEVKFRGASSDVRYIELGVRRPPRLIAMSEIVIGPNCGESDAEARIRQVLEDSGYVTGTMEYPAIVRSAVSEATVAE